jgi:DNA-binding MarR family transcriptional regulator
MTISLSHQEGGGLMATQTMSADPLVDAIATRLRRMDLVGWQRIASWAEEHDLSFECLRLLLALTIEDGPTGARELAELAGLSLHAAYPAIHSLRRSGYLREERRRYALTARGHDLAAALDEAHREGIHAYVDHLDPDERRRIDEAFGIAS